MTQKHAITNTSGITIITLNHELTIKLRFGLPACQSYANMVLGEDSEKYINGFSLTAMGIAKLIQFGYENNCLIDDSPVQITFGKFMLFVEEMIIDNPDELKRIVKVFDESRYTKKASEQMQEITDAINEAKKKTGNTSKVLHSTSSNSHRKSITPAHKESLSLGQKGTNAEPKKKSRKKK